MMPQKGGKFQNRVETQWKLEASIASSKVGVHSGMWKDWKKRELKEGEITWERYHFLAAPEQPRRTTLGH